MMKFTGKKCRMTLPIPLQKEKEAFAGHVLKKDFPKSRLIVLNNEKKHNTSTPGMICWLRDYLIHQPHSEDVTTMKNETSRGEGCVYIMTGAGEKSFCAGGDVVAMMKQEPKGAFLEATFQEIQLYYYLWNASHGNIADIPLSLNEMNSKYNTPSRTPPPSSSRNTYVALWNGYVMGGGVGLSLHGQYRVACPQSMFAMPENTLGFYPDCGAGYFLPRLDRPSEYHKGAGIPGVGLYLGLLGARVKGADLVHTGLATHYVKDLATLRKLQDELCGVGPGQVEEVLDAHAVPYEQLPPFTLEAMRPLLERTFTLRHNTTVEDVVAQLVKEAGDASQPVEIRTFAEKAFSKVRSRVEVNVDGSREAAVLSPTSLQLSFYLQEKGAMDATPFGTHEREYYGCIYTVKQGHEFTEGVRSLLVDKDNRPQWIPATLKEVTAKRKEIIDAYFLKNDTIPVFDPFIPCFAKLS